jgi:hypothetical protein
VSIKIPVQPYFTISHIIKDIKSQFKDKDLSSTSFKEIKIRTGGRIIGRRKASKDLIFLDI